MATQQQRQINETGRKKCLRIEIIITACRKANVEPARKIDRVNEMTEKIFFPNVEQHTRIPACYFRYSSFSPNPTTTHDSIR
jgi:hypothetical protein